MKKPCQLLFSPVDPDKPYFKPVRHYQGDAGFDLTVTRLVTIHERGFAQIPSNVRVALPDGVWGFIMGRSSTFYKKGLLVNPACIDNGWRGELWAMVYNPTDKPITVMPRDRLVQLVLFNLVTPTVVEVKAADFPIGDRGPDKGFGSTGG